MPQPEGPGRLEAELESARRRIESLESLGRSEARLRRLLEQCPDIILTLDRQGTILFVNRTLPQYTVEQVTGTCALSYLEETDRQRFRDALERAMETGRLQWLELSASGPTFWLTRLIPIGSDGEDSDGRSGETALVIATDITERRRGEELRRRLEAQVQRAQKLESLGLLAGGIAHDFNNLLTSILGSASLAAMGLPSDSPAAEQIQRVIVAAERATELTGQMIAYVGKGKFVMQPVDVNALIEEVTRLIRPMLSKTTNLELSFAENLPAVDADKSQLQQVVVNLATNASEAIGESEGKVRIRTGAMTSGQSGRTGDRKGGEGPHVFIEVSDDGMGMDRKTQEKIFDPFFSTKFTGRGLGLAAAQGIIRAHRGTIRVEGEPGRGSTFTVLLPVVTSRTEPVREEIADGGLPAGGVGTVLVVDDENNVRKVAQLLLEESGFRVLSAKGGEEAVILFEQRADEIDAVLLDWFMPRMSGEKTLRALRRVRPEVRVIVTSGFSESEVSEAVPGGAVAGFVQKPFRAPELIEGMRKALGR